MMLFALAQHSDAGYQEACGCCTNHEQYVFMCHLVHNEYISLMYYAQPTKANALIAKILDKTMSQNMEHMRDPSRFVMGCARAARHRVSQALHLTSIIDKQTLFLKFNFSQKILFKNTFRFLFHKASGNKFWGVESRWSSQEWDAWEGGYEAAPSGHWSRDHTGEDHWIENRDHRQSAGHGWEADTDNRDHRHSAGNASNRASSSKSKRGQSRGKSKGAGARNRSKSGGAIWREKKGQGKGKEEKEGKKEKEKEGDSAAMEVDSGIVHRPSPNRFRRSRGASASRSQSRARQALRRRADHPNGSDSSSERSTVDNRTRSPSLQPNAVLAAATVDPPPPPPKQADA